MPRISILDMRQPIGHGFREGRMINIQRPESLLIIEDHPEGIPRRRNGVAARDLRAPARPSFCLWSFVGQPQSTGGRAGVELVPGCQPLPDELFEDGLLRAFMSHLGIAMERARFLQRLEHLNSDLVRTQNLLVQESRMRAVGELASAVAHDLNNLSGIVVMALSAVNGVDPQNQQTISRAERANQAIGELSRRLQRIARSGGDPKIGRGRFAATGGRHRGADPPDLSRRWNPPVAVGAQRAGHRPGRSDHGAAGGHERGAERARRRQGACRPSGARSTSDSSGGGRGAARGARSGAGRADRPARADLPPVRHHQGRARRAGPGDRAQLDEALRRPRRDRRSARRARRLLPPDVHRVGFEAAPRPARSSRPAAKRLRILVVDDEPEFVAVVRETLLQDGHEVVGADNGDDALSKVAHERLRRDPDGPGLAPAQRPGGRARDARRGRSRRRSC